MNQLEKLKTRNKIRQLIRISNRHKDVLRWSSNETENHLNMKFKICKYLKKKGIEFYSEAILNNGLRCDIISADEEKIIEVVNSETEKSIARKKKVYPLEVVFVDAYQDFREELIY